MKLIRCSRQSNLQDEIQRLKGAGVLNDRIEMELDQAVQSIRTYVAVHGARLNIRASRPENIKMLYMRALEIKELYKGKYDVFLHAQSGQWALLHYLIKELWRRNQPSMDLHHFKFLRAPNSTATPDSWGEWWHQLTSQEGINKYRDRPNAESTLSDSDSKVREDLLSADACFFNSHPWESSMFYLMTNTNIASGGNRVQEVVKEVLAQFHPSLQNNLKDEVVRRLMNIIQPSMYSCGNLFVMCIPKEQTKRIYYRAHPFGPKCTCYPDTAAKNRAIINSLQQNAKPIVSDGVLCKPSQSNKFTTIPQFRIYTESIRKPGSGTKIFLLHPLQGHTHRNIKQSIRSIISQIPIEKSQAASA